MTSPNADFAAMAIARIRECFPPEQDEHARNFLKLAGEAGEAVEAFSRYAGYARRRGPLADVAAELADVVLTAYVSAASLGIDLDEACQQKAAVISGRPWREEGGTDAQSDHA
jgi:NTP pyrophosphatase (non-canonical NTP hydrolase)